MKMAQGRVVSNVGAGFYYRKNNYFLSQTDFSVVCIICWLISSLKTASYGLCDEQCENISHQHSCTVSVSTHLGVIYHS